LSRVIMGKFHSIFKQDGEHLSHWNEGGWNQFVLIISPCGHRVQNAWLSCLYVKGVYRQPCCAWAKKCSPD
jgi:hypothetical protein